MQSLACASWLLLVSGVAANLVVEGGGNVTVKTSAELNVDGPCSSCPTPAAPGPPPSPHYYTTDGIQCLYDWHPDTTTGVTGANCITPGAYPTEEQGIEACRTYCLDNADDPEDCKFMWAYNANNGHRCCPKKTQDGSDGVLHNIFAGIKHNGWFCAIDPNPAVMLVDDPSTSLQVQAGGIVTVEDGGLVAIAPTPDCSSCPSPSLPPAAPYHYCAQSECT